MGGIGILLDFLEVVKKRHVVILQMLGKLTAWRFLSKFKQRLTIESRYVQQLSYYIQMNENGQTSKYL